jgi:phosphoglycerate kinase
MGLETGKSLVEADRVDMARDLLGKGGDKLVLPIDAIVAPTLSGDAPTRIVTREAIPADQAMFDIGPLTIEAFAEAVVEAKTVLWNGPMGVFETPPFDAGTLGVAHALVEATEAGATTIVGGGDSAAAIADAGLEDRVTHVSTGGGASLEFLEGKLLPGVAALDDA